MTFIASTAFMDAFEAYLRKHDYTRWLMRRIADRAEQAMFAYSRQRK